MLVASTSASLRVPSAEAEAARDIGWLLRLPYPLRNALGRLSVKDAVDEVAGLSGQHRRDVYRRALTLKTDSDGPAD